MERLARAKPPRAHPERETRRDVPHRPAERLPPGAVPDSRCQTAVGSAEGESRVFGERCAERPAASRSMVTGPSVPGRRDIVACVSRTFRFDGRAARARPGWSAEASLDRRPAFSMGGTGPRKPPVVNCRWRASERPVCKVAEGKLVRLEKDILRKSRTGAAPCIVGAGRAQAASAEDLEAVLAHDAEQL